MADAAQEARCILYQDLPLVHEGSIRVLKVQKYRSTANIPECSLEVVKLQDFSGRFDALSYTWGDAKNAKNIRVNGTTIQCRNNLFDFLVRLSCIPDLDYIWADAICINQNDDMEKSHQVRLMSRIYRYARRVRVWLGNTSHGPDPGKTGLRPEYEDLGERELESKARQDLAIILSNPYWSRLWIVQEFVLGREVSCHQNMLQYDATHLQQWCAKLGGDNRQMQNIFRARGEYMTMQGLGQTRMNENYDNDRHGGFIVLCDLISDHRDQKCSDIRDHIYGIMGWMEGPQGFKGDPILELLPDYTKSVVWACWVVFRSAPWLQNWDILMSACKISPTDIIDSIPQMDAMTLLRPVEWRVEGRKDRDTSDRTGISTQELFNPPRTVKVQLNICNSADVQQPKLLLYFSYLPENNATTFSYMVLEERDAQISQEEKAELTRLSRQTHLRMSERGVKRHGHISVPRAMLRFFAPHATYVPSSSTT